MERVRLIKVCSSGGGPRAVKLSNGHFVDLQRYAGPGMCNPRLDALRCALAEVAPWSAVMSDMNAIEYFIEYGIYLFWHLDAPTRKDPNMYASNYAVTFRRSNGRATSNTRVTDMWKEALSICGEAFYDLVDRFHAGEAVRVIINSDQFVKFFLLRREHLKGLGIRWDDVEKVSNPAEITDLSHLR